MSDRIGVLGGTFDPIHYGHLVAAESAREAFRLDRVLLVPAGIPPHKDVAEVTASRHRAVMTELATLNNPALTVSRVDLDRKGKSYTVDTIEALKDELGEDAELFFILGADSLADVPNWHQPDHLLASCTFIVTTRPGWDLSEAKERLGELYDKHADRIHAIEIPALEISSREIRERLREGRSVRYLVPDLVLRYIEEQGIYA